MTKLDQMLWRLLERVPQWRDLLDPSDVELVEQRLGGATLEAIGVAHGLTRQGIRVRLYGYGNGARRSGGIAGRLRGRFIRDRNKATSGLRHNP
ncbi:MAG TPA: hypothetical protein VGK74_18385 [Symbiobacteriaceae bacterium]